MEFQTVKRKIKPNEQNGGTHNPHAVGGALVPVGQNNPQVKERQVDKNLEYMRLMSADNIGEDEEIGESFIDKIDKMNPFKEQKTEPQLDFILDSLYKTVQYNNKEPCTFLATIKCNDDFDYEKTNLGVDIVCVIDQSGSMRGEKNRLVQDTLQHLISLLTEKDRVSIIRFANDATCLSKLKKCTKKGKQELVGILDNLSPDGGTNIPVGLAMAAKVILGRKYINDVSSIFLLSDGMNNDSFDYIDFFIKDFKLDKIPVTINSFGYGTDNDTKLMKNIATLKNGSFYFINSIEKIKECFLDAFGALKSAVYQEISGTFDLLNGETQSKIRFSKTFGNQWKLHRDTKCAFEFEQLRAGSRKDFVFQVDVPQEGRDSNSSKFRVRAEFHYKSVVFNQIRKKTLEREITIESIFDFSAAEPSHEVSEQLIRVEGAEAIERALEHFDRGESEAGIQLIDIARSNILLRQESAEGLGTKKKILMCLDETAGTLKRKVKKDVGVDIGLLREVGLAHMNQNSTVNENMYACGTQKKMLKKR